MVAIYSNPDRQVSSVCTAFYLPKIAKGRVQSRKLQRHLFAEHENSIARRLTVIMTVVDRVETLNVRLRRIFHVDGSEVLLAGVRFSGTNK